MGKAKDYIYRCIVFACDVASIGAAYWLAYWLRFDFHWYEPWQSIFWKTLPLVAAVQITFCYIFRLYHAVWTYASVTDLLSILKSIFFSQILVAATILFWQHEAFPRSVLIIQPLLAVSFLCATRLGIRFSRSWRWQNQEPGIRTLIVGDGDLVENTLRVLRQTGTYHLLGIISEQAQWWDRRIHGVRVYGGKKHLPSLIKKFKVSSVVVTTPPSHRGAVLGELIALCHQQGVPKVSFKLVRGLDEVLASPEVVSMVRHVQPADLLNREVVRMDKVLVESEIRRARVLVTGAGGTIGSELCRQIARFGPSRLIALESNANSLFYLEREMKKKGFPVTPVLADIRDSAFLQSIFRRYAPQLVFHAAAHKHVAQLENNVKEAIKNNVLGTAALVKASQTNDVSKFVLISTDKAVRPSSVMGATKNIAEQIVRTASVQSSCKFMAVRFGNVLGSSGSVVRLFEDQIARGGPVTVSHPDVTRYFMTVQESVQLILQAAARGQGGEIFILRMGDPVRIVDLAEKMILLHGLEPHKDIAIEFTGLKAGEKKDEELMEEEEESPMTHDDPYMYVLNAPASNPERLQDDLLEMRRLVYEAEDSDVVEKLRQMVPKYLPFEKEAEAPLRRISA